ncbi:MAG: hypothetical protein C4547_03190 [Phycisphaerales bacterium]|nr:MAG: hypothetical protein C4547_03190 [Phycisphaerales bacterium]
MKTVTLNLTPELHTFLESKVRSGEFPSVDEVIQHAIEEMRRDEGEWSPEVLAYYRREVGRGVRQARAGQLAEFTAEDIIAQGRARLARESDA